MSARRMRARTSAPGPGSLSHTNSVGSTSSSRAERNTRSKPHKSSSPHSTSSDDVEDRDRAASTSEPRRSSRRGQDNKDNDEDDDEDDDLKEDEDADDDQAEEEEITRCVCGFQEYQGAPDTGTTRHGKNNSSSDLQSEEAGGLFIQCDKCKVWQHGGCVGIMDETASPDEYFCEKCRKDLHKLMTSLSGQKYSQYLPVVELTRPKSSRKTSIAKESDGKSTKEKQKTGKGVIDGSTKRRSTMNSRAALEEEEALRKALEESKTDAVVGSTTSSGRKSKRSRDESEDSKPDVKRPRTQSESPSTPERLGESAIETDDEIQSRPTTSNSNKKAAPRGVAAKNQREKEAREKLQAQQQQAQQQQQPATDAAKGRNGRAKRGEGKPTSAGAQYRELYSLVSPADPDRDMTEASKPTPTTSQPPEEASEPPPDTPSATASATAGSKKGNAPQEPKQKQKGKKGRAQNAREVPTPPANAGSPKRSGANGKDTSSSPKPSSTENGHRSSDDGKAPGPTATTTTTTATTTTTTSTAATATTTTTTTTTTTKPKKQSRFDKTSWNDMRRLLNTMQEYVTKWEVEMASPYNQALNEALLSQGVQPKGVGNAFISPEEMEALDRLYDAYKAGTGMERELLDRFNKLNTVQMRIVLTRRGQKLREEYPQFE